MGLCAHGAAVLATLVLPHWWMMPPALVLILCSGVRYWRLHVTRSADDALVQLRLDEDMWQARTRVASLSSPPGVAWLTPVLVHLQVGRRGLVLFRDTVEPDAWRRLRAHLKLARHARG